VLFGVIFSSGAVINQKSNLPQFAIFTIFFEIAKMTKKPYETLYQSIARLYNFIQI
jgi:hypothetical protein